MPHVFKPISPSQIHQLQLLDRSPVQTPVHTAAHTPCSTPTPSPPSTPRPLRARTASNLAVPPQSASSTPTALPNLKPKSTSTKTLTATKNPANAKSNNDENQNPLTTTTLHHVNRTLSLTSLPPLAAPPPPIPPLTLPVPLHQAPDFKFGAAEGVSHLDRSPVHTAFQTRVSSPNLAAMGVEDTAHPADQGKRQDQQQDERLISHGVETARVTVEALRERVGEVQDTTDTDDEDNELSEVASESLEIEGYISSGKTSDAGRS